MSSALARRDDTPTSDDLIVRLERSLELSRSQDLDWATRATPLQVVERLQALEADYHRIVVENAELRELAKSTPPLMEMKTWDFSEYLSGFLMSARLLEVRGDRCHVSLKRSTDGEIVGLTLSVEDK